MVLSHVQSVRRVNIARLITNENDTDQLCAMVWLIVQSKCNAIRVHYLADNRCKYSSHIEGRSQRP